MKTPTHLQHRPVLVVDDYDAKDGIYAGKSDAKALSIGRAQYDENEFSAKVFRNTGKTWSRQSEELPLHRILDLAILIAGAIKRNGEADPNLTLLGESVVSDSGFQDLKDYLGKNAQHLQPRLAELKKLL